MPCSESFLNIVRGSPVGEPVSSCRTKNFDKVHLFKQHYSKNQPVGEALIADVTSSEDYPSVLPRRVHGSTLQSSEGMDLVVVGAVQPFDSFKSFPYPFPTPGPGTSCCHIRGGDVLWVLRLGTQAMWSDSNAQCSC